MAEIGAVTTIDREQQVLRFALDDKREWWRYEQRWGLTAWREAGRDAG
jgi:hypothetical protein